MFCVTFLLLVSILYRWFGLRIDTICVLFIGLIAFVCIALVDGMCCNFTDYKKLLPFEIVFDSGLIALALTYTTSLTGLFQYCVRESAEVESLVSSIISFI